MEDDDLLKKGILHQLKTSNPALCRILTKAVIKQDGGRLGIIVQARFYERHLSSDRSKRAIIEAAGKAGYIISVINVEMLVPEEGAIQKPNIETNEASQPDAEDGAVESSEDRIYLKTIAIRNFRLFKDTMFSFNKKVNVIIGANNVGKSTLIDALRLALQVGKYKKTYYVSPDDFNNVAEPIQFDLVFYCPKEFKGMPGIVVTDDPNGERLLELHITYKIVDVGSKQQVRQFFSTGKSGGKKVDDEGSLALFSYSYLGALRDATAALRPSTKSKIADLLLNLRDGDDEEISKIESAYKTAQEDQAVKDLVSEADASVLKHLSKIAIRNDQFDVGFQPLPPKYEELVGTFDIGLSIDGVSRSLPQNGLGYNNVLYTSTVLGHIEGEQKRDAQMYHALLIEEPEAHLHPQLEDSFFKYLSGLGLASGSQLIVTTHSAIISSTTSIDNILLLYRSDEGIESKNLSLLDLSEKETRQISRYLDVTKSRFLFARAVIFVEGISEKILLPILADMHFGEEGSLVKRGIEVVDIDGVSFAPYAAMFKSEYRLPMRAAIVTDRDEGYKDELGETHDTSSRAENILARAGGNLDVFITGARTFEVDLWDAGNIDIMKAAMSTMFPRSVNGAEAVITRLENSDEYGKGDLAQALVDQVVCEDKKLIVPEYINKALDWVDEGDVKQRAE